MAAARLKACKNPPFIVFGDPQTTESKASAKLALRSGLADVIALGEGEETLLQLYEEFTAAQGVPAKLIPGTMRGTTRPPGFESAPRPLVRISKLPLPAFDKMPLTAYQRLRGSARTITYELSRGCTDKCVFCSEWVFWKRIRNDEVGHVVDNVAQLKHRYGCEVVWFMDSLLNATENRLRHFSEELLRKKVDVKWGGYLRANVDRDTARLLKRSGCEFVFVGVESLADETLEQMNKRRTEQDNLGALESLLGAGVDRVVAGFIPGFPGDTRNRFTRTALTLARVRDRYPGRFRVNVEPFILSPGQPMYGEVAKYGLTPTRWDEDYLDIDDRYRDITDGVFCSVDGPNQGIDRMGEVRIAQTVTATAAPELDPFLYYEGEKISTSEMRISEMLDGWYMGLLKTTSALVYGLILDLDERADYERLIAQDAAGEGYGYGTDPGETELPLLRREPFATYLRGVESRHLVPPRRDAPDIRNGTYHRHRPQTADEIALSPFVVVRCIELRTRPALVVLDSAAGRWHVVDDRWIRLFQQLARGPATLDALGATTADDPTDEVARLGELGVLWVTRAHLPPEPAIASPVVDVTLSVRR